MLRSPRRLMLAGAGLVCVGLALLGAVLPGLPTTVFLILASYLFTRSCPWLEERLLGLRPFRPYMRFVNGDRAMPPRARAAALLMMWGAVATSLLLLSARGLLTGWIAAPMVLAALSGSVMILRWGPRSPGPPLPVGLESVRTRLSSLRGPARPSHAQQGGIRNDKASLSLDDYRDTGVRDGVRIGRADRWSGESTG